MTVRVNKDSFNLREKLSELERPIGLKGSELMKSETVQEARDLVSAGRKNMIINGAMQIAERGTSVASGVVTNANTQYYTCDRFYIFGIGNDTAEWTNSQSTDAPEGFSNSWKWDCTTAHASPDSSVRQQIGQVIEAQNLQHLNYGTSKAKEITLSFWVKATKRGLNYIFLYHYDNNDFLAHKYYINQSNTWEKKTITITGAGAAAIANDNGQGIAINWMLYLGSTYTNGTYQENKWLNWQDTNYNMFEDQTNHADSTSNDFYITGVQLEVGKNATDFEHRSYGEEFDLCRRYFQKRSVREVQMHWVAPWTQYYGILQLNPPMRVEPAERTFGFNRVTNYQPGGGGGDSGTSIGSSGLGNSCIKVASESSRNGYDDVFINNTDTGSFDIYISAEF